MSPSPGWRGRAYFGDGLLVYAGAIGPTDLHAHPTTQVTIAYAGQLAIRDASGRVARRTSFVIPPRAPHAIVDAAPRALVLHLPPRRALASSLVSSGVAGWRAPRALGPRALAWPEDWASAVRLAAQAQRALGSGSNAPPVHPAVRRTLARLPTLLDGPVALDALAAAVELSPSRLSHVFSAEVGASLRTYVRWLRLRLAATSLARGASLTEAAHDAGFVDGPHMTHTFRDTFGLAPSALTAELEWVVDGAAAPYKRPGAGARTMRPHEAEDSSPPRTRAQPGRGRRASR